MNEKTMKRVDRMISNRKLIFYSYKCWRIAVMRERLPFVVEEVIQLIDSKPHNNKPTVRTIVYGFSVSNRKKRSI